jgi:Fe-S oxidoreductase
LDEEKLKKFSEMVYRCTLCGECSVSCPVSIDAKQLWTALRETLVEMGHFPEAAKRMKTNVLQAHNVSGDENEERTEWLEFLDELPDHQYKKEKAEKAAEKSVRSVKPIKIQPGEYETVLSPRASATFVSFLGFMGLEG